jgi:antitoxin component YwqK of YwqJK toxin-antitoxin module
MRLLKISLFCLLAYSPMGAFAETDHSVEMAMMSLRPRQPNWHTKVVEQYPDTAPARVFFYETDDHEQDVPVKQVMFYPNGQIKSECDLVTVSETSKGFERWKTKEVPHGAHLSFTVDGKVEKISYYEQGLLHGEAKLFYPSGKIRSTCPFSHGQREGLSLSYYEDGSKAEEIRYQADKVVGEAVMYHPKDVRAAQIPYEDGVIQGMTFEWYPTGALKASRHYEKGKLQSDGKNPAVIAYYEDHSVQEMQDFKAGEPVGSHVKYHPNGKESYKVVYKNGKKEGKEQFFSTEGKVIGEGLYVAGNPVKAHFRNHPNGNKAFSARYNDKGELVEPMLEYNEKGQKIRQSFFVAGERDGDFFEWYDNGQLKVDYHFVKGKFEGEQKEYYSSGKLQMKITYRNNIQEGIYEEWHENGQLKIAMEFAGGRKEKYHREWDAAGNLILEGFYEKDQPHGLVQLWYGKDLPKQRIEFLHGKKHGKEEEFYANGKQRLSATYKDGLLEGKLEAWFEDGSLQCTKQFKAGHPVGEQREYYPKVDAKTQQLARFYHYDDEGRHDGEQKTYYQNGVVQGAVGYKAGVLHGMKGLWDQKGNLVEESFYENGKLNGRYFEKGRDGKEVVYHYKNNRKEGAHYITYPMHETLGKVKAIEANFVNDKAEGEVIEYNETGGKVSSSFYKNGLKEGIAQGFGPNGQLFVSFSFKNDKRSGPALQYFPNGKVAKEAHFIDDVKQGDEKTYHENGKLASLIQYQDGKEHGISRNWNKDGVLVFEGEYKEGKKHGKFNKYYDDGSPRLLQVFVDDQLDGLKKSYDEKGAITESRYHLGKKLS